jgi:hypothetical protein
VVVSGLHYNDNTDTTVSEETPLEACFMQVWQLYQAAIATYVHGRHQELMQHSVLGAGM